MLPTVKEQVVVSSRTESNSVIVDSQLNSFIFSPHNVMREPSKPTDSNWDSAEKNGMCFGNRTQRTSNPPFSGEISDPPPTKNLPEEGLRMKGPQPKAFHGLRWVTGTQLGVSGLPSTTIVSLELLWLGVKCGASPKIPRDKKIPLNPHIPIGIIWKKVGCVLEKEPKLCLSVKG